MEMKEKEKNREQERGGTFDMNGKRGKGLNRSERQEKDRNKTETVKMNRRHMRKESREEEKG